MRISSEKGTTVPIVGHLMGVASIVLDDGGTEDEAIAALLHDAAEDHGGRARLEDIRSRFGDAVAQDRRGLHRHVGHAQAALARAQAVIHAARPEAAALQPARIGRRQGAQHLRRCCGTCATSASAYGSASGGADDVLAYYESLVRAYRQAGGGRLVDELERIVRGIQREMGY